MTAVVDRETAAAHSVAATFSAVFGGGVLLPVPVEDIAESLFSLRIIDDHGIAESGTLDPAACLVRVNAAECAAAPMRRRFTIAHEIGHFVLHAPAALGTVFCRVTDEPEPVAKRIEREANRFAAELLMPEEGVRAEASRADCDAAMLADLFQVSEIAMSWRLYNLGLVAARPDQSA
jgi:predicted transcriptional regulator